MIHVTPNELIGFVRKSGGLELPTQKQAQCFAIQLSGDGLAYTPLSTGKQRVHEYRWIKRVCDKFSQTNSYRPIDYQGITHNASYTLALIKAYLDSITGDIHVPTITPDQIKAAYSMAALVYDGMLKAENAVAKLYEKNGLNENSARDFVAQFRHMLKGEVFKRSLSTPALEYFLSEINNTRSRENVEKAISSAWKHIAYYEGLRRVHLGKLRSVLEKFQNSLTGPTFEDVHNSRFDAQIVKASKDSASARRKRLESAKKVPTFTIAKTVVYNRNADVVVEVLFRAKGSCELCNRPGPFARNSDRTPYLEIHHKIPLSQGGEDTVENAVALCPNCHRQQHHGEPLIYKTSPGATAIRLTG